MAYRCVHYVLLETITGSPAGSGCEGDPASPLAVCGEQCRNVDWTTTPSDATCPGCLAFAAVVARLEHRPVPLTEAHLFDAP